MAEPATAESPPRRRASWNLRAIVEDVAGRPIEELQDPSRPPHPYLKSRPVPPTVPVPRRAMIDHDEEVEPDPVDRVYPPFVGAPGRAFHGAEHEHHEETLARHRVPPGGRAAGPSRRPERLYLHYLLLHLDRLGEPSLRYLRSAVDEEIAHRETGRAFPPPMPEAGAPARRFPESEPPPRSPPPSGPVALPDPSG